MNFNPQQYGAPMAPSGPTGPMAPGQNPMLLALAKALGNNPQQQFNGAGSLNYGQPDGSNMPMPAAFTQAAAPSTDYDTQIAQNQMRQRLALTLMQNQKPAYGPLGALSNAIAGYYGGKNFKTAEAGELDIAKAKKADDAARYGALGKQFGLDPGVPIDSEKMLALASTLHDRQYAEQHPTPVAVGKDAMLVNPLDNSVVASNPSGEHEYVPGGNGDIYDKTAQVWLRAPNAETPEQKRTGEGAEAVSTDAAKESEKARTTYRTGLTNAAGGAAKLQRDLGQVEDLFKQAEADGLKRDDLFGPLTGTEYAQRFGAVIGRKAVGYQESLKRLMARMTIDTLSMQSGKNMRLGGGPMINLAAGTLPDLTTSKYDSARNSWEALNEEAQQTRDMLKTFNKEYSGNKKIDPNDFEDRYMSGTVAPGAALTPPPTTRGVSHADKLPSTAPEGTKATDTESGTVYYFRGGKWVTK